MLRGAAGTPFQGGLYHGRIILPSQYPHKPPEFLFLSPNGRFEVGKKICLSISQHHPELWQPGWDIRTALIAIQSFMPTPGSGAIAALDYTDEERRLLATRSLDACKATLSKSGMLDNFTEFLAAPREPAGASAPSPAAAGPPAARPTAPAPAPAPENQAPVFNTPPPSHSGARPSPGATTAPTPPAVAAATPPSIPPESSAACAPGDRQADRASARESQPPVTPAPAVSPARPAAAATTPGSEGLRRRPAAAGGAVHPGAPLGASPPPPFRPPYASPYRTNARFACGLVLTASASAAGTPDSAARVPNQSTQAGRAARALARPLGETPPRARREVLAVPPPSEDENLLASWIMCLWTCIALLVSRRAVVAVFPDVDWHETAGWLWGEFGKLLEAWSNDTVHPLKFDEL